MVVSASGNTCEIRDANSLSTIYSLPHEEKVEQCKLSSDNQTAISLDSNSILRIWNIKNGSLLHTLPFKVNNFYMPSSNDFMIIVDGVGRIQSWSIPTATLLWKQSSETLSLARAFRVSPNDETLAVSSADMIIYLLSPRNGALKQKLIGHTDLVEETVFTHDNNLVISGGRDQTVRVWRVRDGTLIHTINGAHQEWVIGMTLSPNGQYLLTAGGDNKLKIWLCNNWSLDASHTIGLANIVKWISHDKVALQTTTALLIYNLTSRKICGSWFYRNLELADYSANVFVVGTSLGEVHSLSY
jgi:WD40 repeat protein